MELNIEQKFNELTTDIKTFIGKAGAAEVRASWFNFAVLEVTRHGWRWRVPECFRCGRVHIHAAGFLNDSPRQFLNHKSAYCATSGYELRDGDPARTARLVEYVRRGLPWIGVAHALERRVGGVGR